MSGTDPLVVSQATNAIVTQESIKAALADGKPVVIAMPVYQNFYNVSTANGGLYTTISGSNMGYHAVTALAYDATGIRIENQWGTGWGDHGWATLGWAFVNKYVVEARAIGPMVDPDPQPKLVADPIVSGSVNRAATVSGTAGKYTANPTQFDYQWQRDTGSGFSDISGATNSTYATVQDDVGGKVRVVVEASNNDGSVTGTGNAIGPIKPIAPTSTMAPVASGSAKRGQVVTVNAGSWTDNPTSYTYAWQRNNGSGWVAIAGATAANYTVTVDRRQRQAARPGHGQERDRLEHGHGLERARRGHQGRPGQLGRPAGHRHRRPRLGPDRRSRHLERRRQHLQVPVAA